MPRGQRPEAKKRIHETGSLGTWGRGQEPEEPGDRGYGPGEPWDSGQDAEESGDRGYRPGEPGVRGQEP